MADATILLQLILTLTWTCLCDTPVDQKHPLFARFFTSQAVLEEFASTVCLEFAKVLFDVLQAASPTMQNFKTLPTGPTKSWAVYLLVLEKSNHGPRIYIGSGTSSREGVYARFNHYDHEVVLPTYVEQALNEGYTIVHKGLLCWIPIPTASLRPQTRLLVLALEATFAYMFWAMKSRTRYYGMAHMCLWDRNALEYDGCCSHCSLNEGVLGDFQLSAEDLEAVAIEKEVKRLALKAENHTNDHYKQMETNYDEYITASTARVYKSRANNPGRDALHAANRRQKAYAENTFHCERCNISFSSKRSLQDHEKTPKHIRKENELSNPFKCAPCNLGYHNQSNLTRHQKSERHRKAVAALSSSKLD